MTESIEYRSRSPWRRELHGLYVIAKKDAMLYYFKTPPLIHGVLFPVFFFLAYSVRRPGIDANTIVPGMLAMAVFFTASAIGPMVTPWERRSKTYERLISSPVSTLSIILGDVLAGASFGVFISVAALILASVLTGTAWSRMALVMASIALSAPCFAALGVLMAAPPTETPAHVMMLSSLVRMPLLFVSGVFLPLRQMPSWGKFLVPCSPLSYCTDLVRTAFGNGYESYFPVWLDVLMLITFTAVFATLALFFHRRGRGKAL